MEEARYLEVVSIDWGHTLEGSEQHHMLHPHERSKHIPSPQLLHAQLLHLFVTIPSPPAHSHTSAAPTRNLTGEM